MTNNNIVKKRPNITLNTTHVEYFEDLMYDRVNMCSIPKIDDLNIVIRFDIVGHNAGSWTIVVAGGELKSVLNMPLTSINNKKGLDPGPPDNSKTGIKEISDGPACVFQLEGDTFMSIVRREITPQQAFFEKKVQLEGDVVLALKMNVLVNYL